MECKPIKVEDIVGKPYIYGTRYPLFRGDSWGEVEPQATVTLNADGTLTGFPAPDGTLWREYHDGFQISDRNDDWIKNWNYPLSVWVSQDEDGCLFGRYNAYVKKRKKIHGLCLVPATPVDPEKTHIIAIIGTCQKFFTKTVPTLIRQLQMGGFGTQDIKVVVNNSPTRRSVFTNDGIEFLYTPHNAWEMSAFYEADSFNFDYALMLHDTVRVDNNIHDLCYGKLNGAKKWDVYPALVRGITSMGMISKDYAVRNKLLFQKLDNITKEDGVFWEVSGGLLHQATSALAFQQTMKKLGEEKVAGGTIKRQVYRIDSLGITKYMNGHSFTNGTATTL